MLSLFLKECFAVNLLQLYHFVYASLSTLIEYLCMGNDMLSECFQFLVTIMWIGLIDFNDYCVEVLLNYSLNSLSIELRATHQAQ